MFQLNSQRQRVFGKIRQGYLLVVPVSILRYLIYFSVGNCSIGKPSPHSQLQIDSTHSSHTSHILMAVFQFLAKSQYYYRMVLAVMRLVEYLSTAQLCLRLICSTEIKHHARPQLWRNPLLFIIYQ